MGMAKLWLKKIDISKATNDKHIHSQKYRDTHVHTFTAKQITGCGSSKTFYPLPHLIAIFSI
jgi:hypothetical protein